MHVVAMVLWAVSLVAAAFYTRRARNPKTRPLAAYLIFVAVFTMTAFVIFALIVVAVDGSGRGAALDDPGAVAAFLFVVFVPAFFIARWQLRKPPHAPERPD